MWAQLCYKYDMAKPVTSLKFSPQKKNIAWITFWSTSVAVTALSYLNKLIINRRLRVICVHRNTLVEVTCWSCTVKWSAINHCPPRKNVHIPCCFWTTFGPNQIHNAFNRSPKEKNLHKTKKRTIVMPLRYNMYHENCRRRVSVSELNSSVQNLR